MNWAVPLFNAHFGADEEDAVLSVLRSGWLTMGEQVKMLEDHFSREMDGAHVLAVTNCTAGLHLAFAALALGPGDEVLLPSLTFVATANAVRYVGATPVFVDIAGNQDPCIDPDEIERMITPHTRAICIVHYAGFPCDMIRIGELAQAYGLAVVEDCAHSLFSSFAGKRCGIWGDVSAFSLFSNKNMTCGEGGFVVTRNEKIAEDCRLRRSHGMTTVTMDRHKGRATSYDVVNLGFNYRLDEIRASFALAQLNRLSDFLVHRKALWSLYKEALHSARDVQVPDFGNRSDDVGVHIMPIVLPESANRDQVMQCLREHRIQTSIHYPPVHSFASYQSDNSRLLRTEDFARRELTLPFYPGMSVDQVELVVSALKEALS